MNTDDISKLASQFALKDLVFKNGNRQYNIKFNRTHMLQLKGDSSTGKSLMAHDLREQRGKISNFPEILVIDVINRESIDFISMHKTSKYDLVVIDNADILITQEVDKIICKELLSSKTYWIVIGRKWYNCCAYSGCRGILKSNHFRNKHEFYIEYTDDITD